MRAGLRMPSDHAHDELSRCPARRGRARLGHRGSLRPRRHRARRAAHVRRRGAPPGRVRSRRRRRHGRPHVGRVRRRLRHPARRGGAAGRRPRTLGAHVGGVPRGAAAGGRRRRGRPSRRGRPRDRLGPRRPDARRRARTACSPACPSASPCCTGTATPSTCPPGRSASPAACATRSRPSGPARTAWGVQFHIEVTAAAVDGMVRAFPDDAALAAGGAAAVIRTTPEALTALAPWRDLVFDRFTAMVTAGLGKADHVAVSRTFPASEL